MGQSLYFTSKKLSIAFSDNFFSFSDWIYCHRFLTTAARIGAPPKAFGLPNGAEAEVRIAWFCGM